VLRAQAIALLYEITSTYPELLDSTYHISLNLYEGDTRMIIKSKMDFEQKTALLSILSGKGLKVVDCPNDDYTSVLLIY
jgi:hypothetical protein